MLLLHVVAENMTSSCVGWGLLYPYLSWDYGFCFPNCFCDKGSLFTKSLLFAVFFLQYSRELTVQIRNCGFYPQLLILSTIVDFIVDFILEVSEKN